MALDQSLRMGLGQEWSLASLIPVQRPYPLTPDQYRYELTMDEVGPSVREEVPDRDFRSAVFTDSTGATQLECVFEPQGKVLSCWSDQGSAEWHGRCYCAYVHGLRILEFFDICHRRDNNCKIAVKDLGFCDNGAPQGREGQVTFGLEWPHLSRQATGSSVTGMIGFPNRGFAILC